MAIESNNSLALGAKAPEFTLVDVVSGKAMTLDTCTGSRGLLVMFICKHCPYVVHVQDEIARLGRDYLKQNLGIVAISSNDIVAYPDDAPMHLKAMAEKLGFEFPFCFDEAQSVAKAYGAACTPEFFLFDSARTLVYHGQLDSSRPKSGKAADGADLRHAIDALIAGKPVSRDQKPSVGCSIKWRG